jgi:simple sugar transport system ATP-binding protein
MNDHILSAGVSMRGIGKRFAAVQANEALDIDFKRGKVHALLGENGAGKSTLMNILSGLIRPDEGTIHIDGEPHVFRAPSDAMRAGIGMVHQNFRLIDRLSVAENLHLGWEDAPRLASKGELERRARELSDEFHMPVDPAAGVWQLSVGERQRVAILRALVRGADVLVLDEPTAVLTPQESEQLFAVVRRMTERGTTVVLISHKLREVLEVSDDISILRRGRRVATVEAGQTDSSSLARLMVGRDVSVLRRRTASTAIDTGVVAELSGVSVDNAQGLPALRDLSLAVRAGEIVGVAGVAGNGQRELAEVITGLRPPLSGRVVVSGVDLTGASVRAFSAAGVGHVPEDRMATGCAGTESIWRNAILKTYARAPVARGLFVSPRRAKQAARALTEAAQLSTSDVDIPVGTLSGGNVQRLIIAREMDVATTLVVACYPSRGLDVGAIEMVHAALEAARSRGLGVLLISEELDELFALADRIVVLYEGGIAGEVVGADADIDDIGMMMGGADPQLALAAAEVGPDA